MIDSLLLAVIRIATFAGEDALSQATGFFFEREGRLFLVTSRHVVIDEPSGHHPDRLELDLHIDADDIAKAAPFKVPLYHEGQALWRQGQDAAGSIDVAVVELDCAALPATALFHAFGQEHLPGESGVEIGSSLLMVGFPLGFHDTLHHLPVARHAVLASSFGWRFQGEGYFLTDARTHRGASGAPVVRRQPEGQGELPWQLLGIHSARLDIGPRDTEQDEVLGLNCAWYADILLTLTEAGTEQPVATPEPAGAESGVAGSQASYSAPVQAPANTAA